MAGFRRRFVPQRERPILGGPSAVATMTGRIIRSNLLHRKTRTAMTIAAISVEVAMVLLILGLSDGLIADSSERRRGIGADIMIRPSASASLITTGTDGLDASLVGEIESMPGVAAVLGVTISMGANLQTTTGVDWRSFERMTGGVRFIEGGAFQQPHDAAIDTVYARQKKLRVGDTLRVLNHDFHVRGIIEPGKMARVFIPLDTMQELMGWQGQVSQIYVRLDDPGQVNPMIARLRERLADHPIYSMEEFVSQFAAETEQMASSFVGAIMGIALSVGLLVVLLSMYTAVLDRTRDIGILKALGASRGYIVNLFLRETFWLTVAGIIAGSLIAWVARALVEEQFPLVRVLLLREHVLWAVAIAVAGSLAGALYPAVQAARKDPIQALSYE
jgi:putative ABC transport system permease protein